MSGIGTHVLVPATCVVNDHLGTHSDAAHSRPLVAPSLMCVMMWYRSTAVTD